MTHIKRITNWPVGKHSTLMVVLIMTGWLTATISSAQVVIQGAESSDNATMRSEVIIRTRDRTMVPLIKDIQQTTSEAMERTESVTKVRLGDGAYLDWRRAITTNKRLTPNMTEVSTVVNEMDRQGGNRVIRVTTETVEKTDTGEKSETKVFSRNRSGQLTLDRVIHAVTITTAAGQTSTTRSETLMDVNGHAVTQQQKVETTLSKGPHEKMITEVTKSVDHLTGLLAVTAETSTTERSDGGIKHTVTEVRKPSATGWRTIHKTNITEATMPDGSVTRERIEMGRPLHAASTGDRMMEPLMPQRKIVEQETRAPDGTLTVRRDMFRRDVNGEWTRESFSTDLPDGR